MPRGGGEPAPKPGVAVKRRFWQRLTARAPGKSEGSPEMREKVASALEEIRPLLQSDGGDVELVEVTGEGVVRVRLQGACGGCAMSQITLSRGIEARLKQEIPEVVRVEAVAPGEA